MDTERALGFLVDFAQAELGEPKIERRIRKNG